MEIVHGMNEIVFFLIFRTQYLYQPYAIKRSKIIKEITITKLNRLELELQSEKNEIN